VLFVFQWILCMTCLATAWPGCHQAVSDTPVPHARESSRFVHLDRVIHFTGADDADQSVPPGYYRALAGEPGLLQLVDEENGTGFALKAQTASYDVPVTEPTLRLIARGKDERHLVWLLPDGAGLDATGSVSGIRTRGQGLPLASSVVRSSVTQTPAPSPAHVGVVGGHSPPQALAPSTPGAARFSHTPVLSVVPRLVVENLFRREQPETGFIKNGAPYYRLPKTLHYLCPPNQSEQSQLVALPDLVWGVSNIGTAVAPAPLKARLWIIWNNTILQELGVSGLLPKHDLMTTFHRSHMQVRVTSFPGKTGCYISPAAQPYYEDRPLRIDFMGQNPSVYEIREY